MSSKRKDRTLSRFRNCELNSILRSRICELHSIDYEAIRIHKIHLEININIIKIIIRREVTQKNNETLSRSDASRKITKKEKNSIYNRIQSNSHVKTKKLMQKMNKIVIKRTVMNLLHEMRLRRWKQRDRSALTSQHAAKRLVWVRRYAHFRSANWVRVKWIDECLMKREREIETRWIFTRSFEQMKKQDVHSKSCEKEIKQMFWADFDINAKTELIELNENLTAKKKKVTEVIIWQLYETQISQLILSDDIFMQNNTSVYRSQIVNELLNELKISINFTIMKWSSYSSNLNSIENLWAILKKKIYELFFHLKFAADTEKIRHQLTAAVKIVWRAIDSQILMNLTESMSQKVQIVIDVESWYIKY